MGVIPMIFYAYLNILAYIAEWAWIVAGRPVFVEKQVMGRLRRRRRKSSIGRRGVTISGATGRKVNRNGRVVEIEMGREKEKRM